MSPYGAFSNSRAHTGTNPQPSRYLGNAYDSGTKLYDSHARMYDPSAGRFLTEDPIKGLPTVPQTLNPYPCSANNPLRYPDPSGMLGEGLADGAAAGAGGGGYYLTARADKDGSGATDCSAEGYLDLNYTQPVVPIVFVPIGEVPVPVVSAGATAGVQVNEDGVYLYVGGGLMDPVRGGSATVDTSNPTTGHNNSFQFSIGYTHQENVKFGPTPDKDVYSDQDGIGNNGASVTSYYVFEPPEFLRGPCFGRS